MSLNYMQAIGYAYPNVGCHCSGDPNDYTQIIYDSGDPIPDQATLDTWIANNPASNFYQPRIVQVQSGTFGPTSTNAVIAYGTTAPASTDGAQVFSATFTPTSTSSKIAIRIQFFVSHTATAQTFITGAVFRNSTCIRAEIIGNVVSVQGVLVSVAGNQAGNSIIELFDYPNTNSAVTYCLRVGTDTGSGTLYINQGTAGQTFGGGAPEKGVYTIVEVL